MPRGRAPLRRDLSQETPATGRDTAAEAPRGDASRPPAPGPSFVSRLELQLEQTALVVAVAAAAALLGWLAGHPPGSAAEVGEHGGTWALLTAGFESDAPILLLFVCLLLVALVAPRWRSAAVARRNRELRDLVAASESRLARANAELERLAFLDPLTQIPNRRGFEQALARACSGPEPVALALIDVDRLKWVNDRFGHPAGDVVLRQTGEALARVAGGDPDVAVARIGGDEFGLVFSGRAAGEAAARIAALLIEVDRGREPLPGVRITLSVGWSRSEGENDPAGLMCAADAALYQAKRGGSHGGCDLLPAAGSQGPSSGRE